LPQLGLFDTTVQTLLGPAVAGSSVTLFREGATVNGNQSSSSPFTVTVRHPGKIAAGDTVFINTTTGTTYSVNSTTATTVVIAGFVGTLVLTNGDRIVPSNTQPTLYGDDQGGATVTNPLTTDANGFARCWMEFGAYDFTVSGAGLTIRLLQGHVTPTEAPGQLRYADAFAVGSNTGGVQEAVTDLFSGGVVTLSGNKTYTLSSNLSIGTSGITLRGAGRTTVLSGQVDLVDGVNDLTFEDLTFQPSSVQYGVRANAVSNARLKFTRCTFKNGFVGCSLYGSATKTQKDITFTDCVFETNGAGAAAGSIGLDVFGNIANYSLGLGIFNCLFDSPNQLAIQLQRLRDIRIVGNRFVDCGTTNTADPFGAIWLSGVDRVTISGNVFNVPTSVVASSRAITFRGGGGCNDVAVTGNSFYRTRPNCIEINGLFSSAISGNCFDSWQSAEGIMVGNSLAAVDGLAISGNVFKNGSGPPVYFKVTTGTAFRRITVSGNLVDIAANDGITLDGEMTEFAISGNCVVGTAGVGIKIPTPSSGTIQPHQGTIAGNLLRPNGGANSGYVVSANNGTPRADIITAGNYSSGTFGGDAQTITAVGQAIVVRESPYVVVSADGVYTLTSAPTIADGFDTQEIWIINYGANAITMQDQGTLPSSNLRLGAATRVLGTRDNMLLRYNATVGDWVEVAFSNVI